MDVITRYDRLLNELVTVNTRRKEALGQIEGLRVAFDREADLASVWDRAGDLLRSFSAEESQSLQADIERLVSYALTAIFDEPFAFKVTTRVLRNAPSVEFTLESGGVERPVLGSHGGGVSQVVGFILRALIVVLSPSLRNVLVLDEPFGQVSANYRPRLAAFIRELVDSTGLQIILVTHDLDLPAVADVHYEFTGPGRLRYCPEVPASLEVM